MKGAQLNLIYSLFVLPARGIHSIKELLNSGIAIKGAKLLVKGVSVA